MPTKKKKTKARAVHRPLRPLPYPRGSKWKTANGSVILIYEDGEDGGFPDRVLAQVITGGHGLPHLRGSKPGDPFSLMKYEGTYPTSQMHPAAELAKVAGMHPVSRIAEPAKKKGAKAKRA